MKIKEVIDKGDPKNKKIAYNFFTKEKGYSHEVALGIIGNLMQESYANLDTTAIGFDGTGSYGIAQWLGSRKDKLKEIRPDDFNTLRGQLEFIDWELNNTEKRAASKLKGAKTAEDAALLFSKYYERPHKDFAHNDKRVAFARKLGDELGVAAKVGKSIEKKPTVAVDNTAVKQREFVPLKTKTAANATYAGLPIEEKSKVEGPSGLNEERLREILSQERKKMESQFLNAFQQQTQPQNNEQQYKQENLDYLYQIEDIEKYSDGGKKKKKDVRELELQERVKDNIPTNFVDKKLTFLDTSSIDYDNIDYGSILNTKKFDKGEKPIVEKSSIPNAPSLNLKEVKEGQDGALDRFGSLDSVVRYATSDSLYKRSGEQITKDIKEGKITKEEVGFIQEKLAKEGYLKIKEIEPKTKEETIALQQKLVSEGFDLGAFGENKDGIDGKFGSKTKAALQKYNENRTTVDNKFGSKTKAALESRDAALGGQDQEIVSDQDGEAGGSVKTFQKTLTEKLNIDTKGIDGDWGNNTQAGFDEFKKYIDSNKQSSYLPVLSKSIGASLGFTGGNLTEDNFSDDDLDLMRKLAVKNGKIKGGFGYESIRKGSDIEGSSVSEYWKHPKNILKSPNAIKLTLTLGSTGIIQAPDGYVYAYDVYDMNDVGDYGESDKRTPQEVYDERLASMERAGKMEGAFQTAYQKVRAKASRSQREAQIEAHEKGEEWKPTAALIKLGKASDLIKADAKRRKKV